MPFPTGSNTLQAIEQKVRRLTRSPSEQQITTADIDNYINTFLVYDFPEHLRTFNLRVSFTFYTNAFQSEYNTDTSVLPITDPLYNFQNLYLTPIGEPVYFAGYQGFYTQSREQFFGIYPKTNFIQQTGFIGDGVTTAFAGVINSQQTVVPPIINNPAVVLLPNQVLFDSIDVTGATLKLIDIPNNPYLGIGTLVVPGTTAALGTINYITGAYSFTFPTAPAANQPINSQSVPQVTGLPQALLYFDNKFVVRPIPDQAYRINFEAYQRPTALLASNSIPQLEEWWQLIAYGCAKKIFEDRMDLESVELIMPEYKQQMNLVNRRTIVQYTQERVATIYTEQTGSTGSGQWWGTGNF